MEATGPDLKALLNARGIDARSVRNLTTGQKNLTLLIETSSGARFVVRQYSRATAEEVQYEFAAIEFLSSRGFPTPAPVRSEDGIVAGQIGGRWAAVFQYAAGKHPDGLDSAVGENLDLGCRAAQLAGHMHSLTWGVDFPGHRTDRLDPLRRITEFLGGPYASLPVMREAVASLEAHATTMSDLYAEAGQIPQGLVHNDISAHNLLVDCSSGRITALIDFDDCMTSYLLYDLGRICEIWARDATGCLDRARLDKLVEVYSQRRRLTRFEDRHTEDFIAGYAAATGIGYLTSKLDQGATLAGPDDSIAMSLFMQLRAT